MGKKIFLLFDSTHLLKCIYNNFRNKGTFVCPDGGKNIYPDFDYIKEVLEIELGQPVKIAHKLTDKVLNPMALEKTNVMLADAAFHESTINALNEYGKDFQQFLQTAKFLQTVRDWWDRFNVKSRNKGKHKRNKNMEPITKDNIGEFSKKMNDFSDWLKEWYKEFPDFCLTTPTYQALRQTVSATVELCKYLLENSDNNGIGYIMLGNLQQDFLEGRFGWYR